MTENNFYGKTRLEEQFPGRIDVFNAAGLNSSCELALGMESLGTMWANTENRFMSDSVCIWSQDEQIDHIVLTNYNLSKETEHLERLASLKVKPKKIIIASFAYVRDLKFFAEQFILRYQLSLLDYESESSINIRLLYSTLEAFDTVYHEPTERYIFDWRKFFRNRVQEIFQMEPEMWYVPMSHKDLIKVAFEPTSFQVCVQRNIFDNNTIRCIFMPQTSYKAFIK